MINKLLKNVFLLINYFVIGLLLIGYAASSISPNHASFLILFSLIFPFLIIINVFAVVFWVVLKKYYFIFSFIALLAGFNNITDTFSVSLADKIQNEHVDFSVLSYNVRVFDLYNWSHNKTTRNNIFKTIRQIGPDIACIQEYYNSSNDYFPVHDSLMTNQKFKYSHIDYVVSLPNKHNFGIATYSVYPIIGKEKISFEDSQNQVLITDLKIDSDTLRVFNCHLESVRFLKEDYQFIDSIKKVSEERRIRGVSGVVTRLSLASKKRASQAEQIKKLIDQSPYSVLVCGDFNDVPSSYTYNTIAHSLMDSHKETKIGIGGTYTRFFPSNRIDYILYDESIKCLKYDRLKYEYSDHYPIIGSYSFVE